MSGYVKALILILAGFVVLLPFTSSYPDGLETVAEALGVREHEPLWTGLMPDYVLPTVENPYLSTLIAGFLGVFLILILSFALGKVISKTSQLKS
ncbi:MAG: PDGLE domain-containing protein [Candidatus Bathyarchaeia archaeon]|nr:PDGLE domain-containing protein [Candidatus Bathyarchaeota archaeon]